MVGLTACQSNTPEAIPEISSQTPEATQTQFIPPTLTPVSVQVSPDQSEAFTNEIFSEDFSGQSSCFSGYERSGLNLSTENEHLLLSILNENQTETIPCTSVVTSNFVFSANFEVVSAGETPSYFYGLSFRMSGAENYSFLIGSENGYCIYYQSSDTFIPLTNSTDFLTSCWALIPDGVLKENNELKIIAVDDRLEAYLNGTLLSLVHDRKIDRGEIGIVAATGAENTLTILIDDLKVYETEPINQ